MNDLFRTEFRTASRHDEREIRKPKLAHTYYAFDVFNALANWAVDEAGGGTAVFGRKPQVADYKPVDAGEEAGRAVKANIANYDDIAKLLEKILPGYKNIVGTESKNIQALLRGEIPQDVQDSIQRTSAFKSLSNGYGGSPMAHALTARDIGRTSLDLTQLGGNASQRWMGQVQNSVAPFTVTTPQQIEVTGKNNMFDQATKQFKYNVEAAPDPSAAGIFNLQTALGAMAASWGMSSAVGGVGGGAASGGGGGNAGAGVNAGASAAANYGGGGNYNYGPWATGYRWGG